MLQKELSIRDHSDRVKARNKEARKNRAPHEKEEFKDICRKLANQYSRISLTPGSEKYALWVDSMKNVDRKPQV
jgi:hypothetical protein